MCIHVIDLGLLLLFYFLNSSSMGFSVRVHIVSIRVRALLCIVNNIQTILNIVETVVTLLLLYNHMCIPKICHTLECVFNR